MIDLALFIQRVTQVHLLKCPGANTGWAFTDGGLHQRSTGDHSQKDQYLKGHMCISPTPFVWNYSHTQTHPGNSVPHLQPQVQLPLQSISPSVATLYFLDLWAANTFFWSDRTSGFQQPRTASLKPHTIVNLGWAVTSSELGLHHKVHSETPRLSAGSKLFSKHLLVLLCCLKQLK